MAEVALYIATAAKTTIQRRFSAPGSTFRVVGAALTGTAAFCGLVPETITLLVDLWPDHEKLLAFMRLATSATRSS
jgi:hypothetical protein